MTTKNLQMILGFHSALITDTVTVFGCLYHVEVVQVSIFLMVKIILQDMPPEMQHLLWSYQMSHQMVL